MTKEYEVISLERYEKLRDTALATGEHLAYVLFIFGWHTGLRINRIMTLEWKNVDLVKMEIRPGDDWVIPIINGGELHKLLLSCKNGPQAGQLVVYYRGRTKRTNRNYAAKETLRRVCNASGIRVNFMNFEKTYSLRTIQHSTPFAQKPHMPKVDRMQIELNQIRAKFPDIIAPTSDDSV